LGLKIVITCLRMLQHRNDEVQKRDGEEGGQRTMTGGRGRREQKKGGGGRSLLKNACPSDRTVDHVGSKRFQSGDAEVETAVRTLGKNSASAKGSFMQSKRSEGEGGPFLKSSGKGGRALLRRKRTERIQGGNETVCCRGQNIFEGYPPCILSNKPGMSCQPAGS